jgi:hypothetical protein
VCGPAKAGTDPHDGCPVESPSSCQRVGTCDGLGACRLQPEGTSCGASTCAGSRVAGRVCDGFGACITSGGTDCAPSLCKNEVCDSHCSTNADCDPVLGYCSGGTCSKKKDLGAGCTGAVECRSGFCTDGVCCNAACSGQCEACDVPGGEGSCVAVRGAPHGARPACAPGTEENPCSSASCAGEESSRDRCASFAGSDVVCRTGVCEGGVQTLEGRCDGTGSCPVETKRCEPFACAGTSCGTTCRSSSDCAPDHICSDRKECVLPATCDGDHTTLGADGVTKTDCSPYRCGARGACKAGCATSDDCVAGALCNAGTCERVVASEAEASGCAVGHGRNRSPRGLAATVLLLLRRRRRREA